MKTLYLECFSGISGDMTVGALLDLGADRGVLLESLKSLGLSGYQIKIEKVLKKGISATSFDVILPPEAAPHTHEDGTTHVHGQDERGLREILPIIRDSGISAKARETAARIFRMLAEAEGAVHGVPSGEVVFHEVGAVDSIVDIVAAAVCLDNLGVERVISSPLHDGTGHAWCRHGKIPVPVPATLELSRMASIPLVLTRCEGEMVTPTGAAVVAALADSFAPPEGMVVEKIGIGAGKKEFAHANVLRAMLLREEATGGDEVCVLTTAVDDSSPEQLAYCQARLFEAGALDAYFTPVFMKKNRPASELTVICRPGDEEALTELLFSETTTIGLRSTRMRRSVMRREWEQVEIDEGLVRVKVCSYGKIKKQYVEYESAAKLAKKSGRPLDEIYRKAYARLSALNKTEKMQER